MPAAVPVHHRPAPPPPPSNRPLPPSLCQPLCKSRCPAAPCPAAPCRDAALAVGAAHALCLLPPPLPAPAQARGRRPTGGMIPNSITSPPRVSTVSSPTARSGAGEARQAWRRQGAMHVGGGAAVLRMAESERSLGSAPHSVCGDGDSIQGGVARGRVAVWCRPTSQHSNTWAATRQQQGSKAASGKAWATWAASGQQQQHGGSTRNSRAGATRLCQQRS